MCAYVRASRFLFLVAIVILVLFVLLSLFFLHFSLTLLFFSRALLCLFLLLPYAQTHTYTLADIIGFIRVAIIGSKRIFFLLRPIFLVNIP